jgi:hypothetical protein
VARSDPAPLSWLFRTISVESKVRSSQRSTIGRNLVVVRRHTCRLRPSCDGDPELIPLDSLDGTNCNMVRLLVCC